MADRTQEEKPWWAEMVREMALTGLATVFMTEDTIRSQLKELRLPKELVAAILENVSKKKDDLIGLCAREFGKLISKFDLATEIGRFLEKHDVKIEAKISFQPKRKEEA
jgi:hypothetical protein